MLPPTTLAIFTEASGGLEPSDERTSGEQEGEAFSSESKGSWCASIDRAAPHVHVRYAPSIHQDAFDLLECLALKSTAKWAFEIGELNEHYVRRRCSQDWHIVERYSQMLIIEVLNPSCRFSTTVARTIESLRRHSNKKNRRQFVSRPARMTSGLGLRTHPLEVDAWLQFSTPSCCPYPPEEASTLLREMANLH